MKKCRKSILTVSALFFVSVLSSPAFAAGPDGYPAYSGPPAELTMWAWTSNENYSIDLFQKAYPNIKIKWTNVGGGGEEYAKILTATSAGSGLPDIIMSEYTYAPEFIQFGSFQPINKWVPESTYLNYFPKVTLKWTAQDGKIYGTPQDSGASTMVYRKDIFDKYGLTVPKTWAEFATMAEKLHKANPKIQPISLSSNWVLIPLGLAWQAGGKMFEYADGKWYINFTNPTVTKVFSYWGKLIKDGVVTPDMWWNADWYKELTDGGAATVVSGGWFPEWLQLNSPDSKGKWRVALVPQWDASKPMNGEMGGSGFYVSSQSKNPEAAALFVLWLNSHKDSILQLHDKAQLPVLWANSFINGLGPSLANQEYPYFGGQKITPVSLEAMNQVAKNDGNAFTALPVMDYVGSSYQTEFKKVTDGQEDIPTFLKNWQDAVVAFMAKQGFSNVVVGQLPK